MRLLFPHIPDRYGEVIPLFGAPPDEALSVFPPRTPALRPVFDAFQLRNAEEALLRLPGAQRRNSVGLRGFLEHEGAADPSDPMFPLQWRGDSAQLAFLVAALVRENRLPALPSRTDVWFTGALELTVEGHISLASVGGFDAKVELILRGYVGSSAGNAVLVAPGGVDFELGIALRERVYIIEFDSPAFLEPWPPQKLVVVLVRDVGLQALLAWLLSEPALERAVAEDESRKEVMPNEAFRERFSKHILEFHALLAHQQVDEAAGVLIRLDDEGTKHGALSALCELHDALRSRAGEAAHTRNIALCALMHANLTDTRGDTRKALDELEAVESDFADVLERPEMADLRGRLSFSRGMFLWSRGRLSEAAAAYQIAAASPEHGIWQARAIGNLGEVDAEQGELESARTKLQEGIAAELVCGDAVGAACDAGTLSHVCVELGDWPAALELGAYSHDVLTRQRRRLDSFLLCLAERAFVLRQLGDPCGAILFANSAIDEAKKAGQPFASARARIPLALSQWDLGNFAAAVEAAQVAQSEADTLGDERTKVLAMTVLARLAMARSGDGQKDLVRAANLLRNVARSAFARFAAGAKVLLGVVALKQGGHPDAKLLGESSLVLTGILSRSAHFLEIAHLVALGQLVADTGGDTTLSPWGDLARSRLFGLIRDARFDLEQLKAALPENGHRQAVISSAVEVLAGAEVERGRSVTPWRRAT